MMVNYAVFFKIAFINAGRNNRQIGNRQSQGNSAFRGKGFLDADSEGGAIRPAADGQHIAAQVDGGTFYALREEVVLHPVGNIAFGNTAQINLGLRVRKAYLIAVYEYVFISYMG